MSQHSPRYQSETMGSIERKEVQENQEGRHPDNLHREIQRLSHLLEMERARRCEENRRLAHLEEELEEMKVHLNRQTDVKEMLISQAENVRSELDRLEKYSDPEVRRAVIIASQTYKDVEDMELKPLKQKYVDLKVAHLLSTETFILEIQDEKAKSQALQEELNELQTSYEELSSKYETDDALVRQEDELTELKSSYDELHYKCERDIFELEEEVEIYLEEIQQWKNILSQEKKENLMHKINYSALLDQVEKLQFQVSKERKKRLKKSEEDAETLETMRAENAVLQEKNRKETLFLKESKKLLEEEIFKIKRSYNDLQCKYNSDVSQLKRDMEQYEQKMQQEEAALSKEKQEKIIQEKQHSELQHQIEKLHLQIIQERESYMKKSEEDKVLLENTRAENAVLQDKTKKEIKLLQDKERSSQAELEKVNGLYQELQCRYEKEITLMKHQAEKYEEEIRCMQKDLDRAREDSLLADSLTDEEEDFQEKHVEVFQEEEEDAQRQVDLIKVPSPQVSSEEELPGEPLPGCSQDPKSSDSTEATGETVLEDLDHPDTKMMKDGKKEKFTTSFWKRLRKMLQLKKPKKKQKNEDDQELSNVLDFDI